MNLQAAWASLPGTLKETQGTWCAGAEVSPRRRRESRAGYKGHAGAVFTFCHA